jgi:hypothetical protein
MKLHELKQVKAGKSVADLARKYDGRGDFFCGDEQLTSLEGAPVSVGGSFFCNHNKLTSLEGAPSIIKQGLLCSNNQLTTLEGAPTQIGGAFYCNNNSLTSLEHCPAKVGDDFYCQSNKLTTLEGATAVVVKGGFFCFDNWLTSLVNVHKHIKEINGTFDCRDNPIKDGLEYILLIKGVKEVSTPNSKFDRAVNNYLETNPSGSMKAVLEIMDLL